MGNKPMKTTAVFAATALVVALTSLPAAAQDDSPFSYAEHTPGARLVAEGKRSYDAGQYASALSKYEAAARWADKFAQFNIGVMHLQGKGTPFDPARALAWFQLAAERDYPMMVTMVEDLDDMVDEETRNARPSASVSKSWSRSSAMSSPSSGRIAECSAIAGWRRVHDSASPAFFG
jgi:TPR repeat protein